MVAISVCIKAVPSDLNVAISRRTGEPALEGMRFIINPWEKRALELALRLREAQGGTVTVLTMDEPTANFALREGLAMGADRAVLLHDRAFEGADTLATARVLAAAVTKARSDVILTGGRTSDRRAAQVGPMLAQILNVPAVTFVTDAKPNGKSLLVRKRIGNKVATYEAPIPCLLSTSDEAPRPRIATAWGVADAFREKPISTWNRQDLDLHEDSVGREGSPTRVRRFEKVREERRVQECEFFEGEPAEVARSFVRRLRSQGVVR
jgi:electron transfer flavoprotein beta subunit